jgi:hypothetical protein
MRHHPRIDERWATYEDYSVGGYGSTMHVGRLTQRKTISPFSLITSRQRCLYLGNFPWKNN